MLIIALVIAIVVLLAFGMLGIIGITAVAALGWLAWVAFPVIWMIVFGSASFVFLAIGHLIRPDDFPNPVQAFAEGWQVETRRRRGL